jgi:hypothetical protein
MNIFRNADLPRDKAELLERIHHSWLALEQTVGQIDDLGMIRPGPDGWSVKDHLAHISAWDEGTAAALQGKPRYPALGVDEETYLRGWDAINAVIYEINRDRPLVDVLADWQATHRHLLAELDRVDDDRLRRRYDEFVPDDRLVDGKVPMLRRVSGGTHEHYDEHYEWIEALIRRSATLSGEEG